MTVADPLSILISVLALAVSLLTAWLTLIRRGTITMTQPTTIFFGRENIGHDEQPPKVYLKSLLFSTSHRGRVVENMYVVSARKPLQSTISGFGFRRAGVSAVGSDAATPA